MILDDPPDQIAWRGALSSGEHLELLEDFVRKFDDSLHIAIVPCSVRPGNFLSSVDRALARVK